MTGGGGFPGRSLAAPGGLGHLRRVSVPASTSPTAISFRGVSKRFGDGPWVLRDLDLEIAPGEFVTLIGPSGCGKSTLLRLASGLTAPTSGEVELRGAPPAASRASLAYIFQDATLLPWLNVRRNIGAPLRLRGFEREEVGRRVTAMLDLVRLGDVGDRYPAQLSGGMRMRVSVARALALRPSLLLMDEPFGALDEMTRNHLNEELTALQAVQGWTGLFVTHSVAEAVFLSTRIVVLVANPGRIHAVVELPWSRPRGPALRQEAAYQRRVGEVLALLRSVEAEERAA